MSDAAVANLITGLVTVTTIVIGFLTLWLKLKYGVEKAEQAATKAATKAETVEQKLDNNTAITRAGAVAAAATADTINRKLNGGVTETIQEAINPLKEALTNHIAMDAHDMEDIKAKIDVISDYVHKRNHDILGALQTLTLQLAVVLKAQGTVMQESGKK